jgi:hypothetical protein
MNDVDCYEMMRYPETAMAAPPQAALPWIVARAAAPGKADRDGEDGDNGMRRAGYAGFPKGSSGFSRGAYEAPDAMKVRGAIIRSGGLVRVIRQRSTAWRRHIPSLRNPNIAIAWREGLRG